MMKLLSHFSLIFTASLLFCGSTFSATTAPAATNLVLATNGVISPSAYDAQTLAAKWPAFVHGPLDSSGFNALSLPFHYEDPSNTGDANEANAFAFLLSNTLDWCPDCYCQRHAFFVFAGSRNAMHRLANRYDPDEISRLILTWWATHAVGGTLIKTADGYQGWLVIYNSSGEVVDQKNFDRSETFFDLLGDMSVEAMQFFDNPPSAVLISHLKTPRCKDRKCLALLGSAAYLDRADMLNVMDKVLEIDPDFSEVRSWAAHQRGWQSNQPDAEMEQVAIALGNYLTAEEMRTFNARRVPGLPEQDYTQWWETASKLSPATSPLMVMQRMNQAEADSKWPPDLIDAALTASAKYPNNYWLLTSTSDLFIAPQAGHVDGDMAASLALAAIQNNFLTGVGLKSDALASFTQMMANMGRADIVCQLLLEEKKLNEPETCLLISSLEDLGQFQKALDVYGEHHQVLRQFAGIMASRAVMAAAMTSNPQAVDQIIAQQKAALQLVHCLKLAYAYRDILAENR